MPERRTKPRAKPGTVQHTQPEEDTAYARAARLQHAAGNRAVAGLLDAKPVQRWAFVKGEQVPSTEKALNPDMVALAKDKLVHAYWSYGEFRRHAAGTTDHIGNLTTSSKAGTWLRFSDNGTNLLGENHTLVTMEDVAHAVGTTSFIYEPFSTDDMPAGSAMKSAYETENNARFQSFGIDQAPDKRKYGAESLYPKMAFGMNLLGPVLATGNLTPLKSTGYFGQPAQRYLKIGWAYAKDVVTQVAALQAATKPVPAALAALAATTTGMMGTHDAFITGLVVDGHIGDALDTVVGRPLVAALATWCDDFTAAMVDRMSTDKDLTVKERNKLGGMPTGDATERNEAFSKWRDFHFAHAVNAAVSRGVRYAGMGNAHLDYLKKQGLPYGAKQYNMMGDALARFEQITAEMKAKAKDI